MTLGVHLGRGRGRMMASEPEERGHYEIRMLEMMRDILTILVRAWISGALGQHNFWQLLDYGNLSRE